MFLFPKKTINVDVFMASANLYNITPIVPSYKCLPQWWKDTKPTYPTPNHPLMEASTIKRCPGLRDLYSSGIMFRMPMDTLIQVSKEAIDVHAKNDVIPIDTHELFKHHDDEMFGEFLKHNRYMTFRVNLPYFIETKEDINWTLSEPVWNSADHRYRIVPGNTNFKYFHSMTVHILFQPEVNPYRILFPLHQPLVHAIALTDKKIKVHNHLVTKEEYDRKVLGAIPGKFFNISKFIKDKEKEKNKCPFHSMWK